jgi:hypothetical protein
MRSLTTMLLALFCHYALFAQNDCGTTRYMDRLRKENPSITTIARQGSVASSGSKILQIPGQHNSTVPGTIIIPVVVHIIYFNGTQNISEDQVNSQIEALNQNFNKENADIATVPTAFQPFAAKTNIRFMLAKVDPEGRATNGITRKKSSIARWTDDDNIKHEMYGGVDAWDSRYYLNIWVSNLSSDLLGYASFPGAPADVDGVVIRSDIFGTRGIAGGGSFNKGRTTVHEVGHWLNLIHLWGDVDCGSDEVEDTPPQHSYNRGCPAFPKLNKYCPAENRDGEMFMNFMDFSDDACMKMFTIGQSQRMLRIFEYGGIRNPILSSKALGEPYNFTPPPMPDISSSAIKIYPNPVSETLHFQTGSEIHLGGKHYVIISADGRAVTTGVISPDQNRLSVQNLMPGIYFLRIGNGKEFPRISFLKN